MNVRVLNAKQAFGRGRNRCRTDLGVAASGWEQSFVKYCFAAIQCRAPLGHAVWKRPAKTEHQLQPSRIDALACFPPGAGQSLNTSATPDRIAATTNLADSKQPIRWNESPLFLPPSSTTAFAAKKAVRVLACLAASKTE
jgi:hypothetical protein